MTSLLSNRKADNRLARMREFLASPAAMTHGQLMAIIDRAFEAGVAAENDRQFAQALFARQNLVIAEGVMMMDEEPGNLIRLATA